MVDDSPRRRNVEDVDVASGHCGLRRTAENWGMNKGKAATGSVDVRKRLREAASQCALA
jgi:hypothetical protein